MLKFKIINPYYITLIFIFIIIFTSTRIYSKDIHSSNKHLKDMIIKLIQEHDKIRAYINNVKSTQSNVDQKDAMYKPSLDLFGDLGKEEVEREYGRDCTESRYYVNLKLTQLLTDFGYTSNKISRAKCSLNYAQYQLVSVRQEVMLKGIKAYINLIRARERLKYAKRSEQRITELTGIEKILVEKGAGLSSDVLQAKSQLTGAKALTVRVMGELEQAKNRIQAVFHRTLTEQEIMQLDKVDLPRQFLPDTIAQGIDYALENNPELKMTELDIKLTDYDRKIQKSSFYPHINAFAQLTARENDEGIDGYRNEAAAGIEFNYNLYRGGGDVAGLNKENFRKKSATEQLENSKRLVEEQVRNAWKELETMRENAALLKNQSSIVREFLELAKKERKMGTRSLLDVLNGEVNYINALSATVTAEQDTKIAAFNLLFAMGDISLDLF